MAFVRQVHASMASDKFKPIAVAAVCGALWGLLGDMLLVTSVFIGYSVATLSYSNSMKAVGQDDEEVRELLSLQCPWALFIIGLLVASIMEMTGLKLSL